MSYGEITVVYDVVLVILYISIVILCVLLLISCKKKKKSVQIEETYKPRKPKLPASSHSFMDIHAATDGFKNSRVIGKGWIGRVYAGVMPTGEVVVVKRIHPHLVFLSNKVAGFGFSSVLKWLSLADHPHLAQITGYSEAPGEPIIVMEFQGLLSLEFYLYHNPEGANVLDWKRRVSIAAGVARGIEYLHQVMSPPIVHGRVKPSNILIDAKFNAKLCDYGLKFLVPREGMDGYLDDDEDEGGGYSKESDVYGVGIVLLELLSGRRSSSSSSSSKDDEDEDEDEEKQGLNNMMVKWALPLIKEMKFSELLDPRLEIPTDIQPLVRLSKVALACVANSRKNRPSITQVVSILNNIENRLILAAGRL